MKFPYSIVLILILLFCIDPTTQLNIPNLFFGSLRNRTISLIEESVGNTECARDLKIFLKDLSLKKPWALQMFDATGKYPGGILAGHTHIYGNYDQCLDVFNDMNDPPIIGQYCKVYLNASGKYSSNFIKNIAKPVEFVRSLGIKINNNFTDVSNWMKIYLGFCLPHSCSSNNLQDISKHVERTLKLPIQMTVHDYNCMNKNKKIFTLNIDKYIISFFCMYAVLLLLSTCYDMIHQTAEGNYGNILTVFSLLRNGRDLFSPPQNRKNNLCALNGMKVLHMLWIMFAHRYLFSIYLGITNVAYLIEWKQELFTSVIMSSIYAVDTFLVLSGLLVSYLFLQYMSDYENMPFSFLKFNFLRCLRLSPSLLALILFNISIFKYLGDGPNWVEAAGKLSLPCIYYWWSSLLFINNYSYEHNICVTQSWYLSVDSQLFFLSPILLPNLKRRPWKTCLACVVICILSGIYTYAVTIQYNLAASIADADKEYMKNLYYPTPVRMPPWFIGIIFGFLIHKYGCIKLNKVNKYMAWMFTSFLLLLPIYAQLHLSRAEEYNAVKAALCNSCIRQVWSTGIGILSYLCSTGNGGIVNVFLSLPVFQKICRITYGIYLTQVPVMAYLIGTKRQSEYFSTMAVAHQVLGDLPIILVAATIWTLAFESPFRLIGKLLSMDVTNTEENKRNSTKNMDIVDISEHKINDSKNNIKKST